MIEKTLMELIKNGGILEDIPGDSVEEALTHIVSAITLPRSLDKETLLTAILERENIMPTSIGNGIAVPHPRNFLATTDSEEFVVISFLKEPIAWRSLDNVLVKTVILIVSSSAKSHLHTLSRVHFFCKQEEFLKVLRDHTSKDEILETITCIEKEWK
ncbi:MAG: PTS sugar transporter subunit IIA [Treponema sp.]|jgi:PTS system nitrogen regulatory IIA component|nr:PTS sugar transporter subunit IIA [Treponema sp.]